MSTKFPADEGIKPDVSIENAGKMRVDISPNKPHKKLGPGRFRVQEVQNDPFIMTKIFGDH